MTSRRRKRERRRNRPPTGVPCEAGRRPLRKSLTKYAIEMQTPSGLMLIGYEEFKASGEWTVGPWVEVPASEFGLSSSAFEQFKSDLRSIAPIRVTKPGAN